MPLPGLARIMFRTCLKIKKETFGLPLTPAWIGCRVRRFEHSQFATVCFAGQRTSNGPSLPTVTLGFGPHLANASAESPQGKLQSGHRLCHPAAERMQCFPSLILVF